jgi:hypothetical protein
MNSVGLGWVEEEGGGGDESLKEKLKNEHINLF